MSQLNLKLFFKCTYVENSYDLILNLDTFEIWYTQLVNSGVIQNSAEDIMQLFEYATTEITNSFEFQIIFKMTIKDLLAKARPYQVNAVTCTLANCDHELFIECLLYEVDKLDFSDPKVFYFAKSLVRKLGYRTDLKSITIEMIKYIKEKRLCLG